MDEKPPHTMTSREDAHWHLDRRVSLGHLITTLVVAVSFLWWSAQLYTRVERNAIDVEHLREIVTIQQENRQRQVEEIKRNIQLINRKLDRLIARGENQ